MTNSVYIHIPFCNNICTYCNFSKFLYNEKMVYDYLNALKREILDRYEGEVVKTLYIGGGTPSSLTIDELQKLFQIIKIFNLDKDLEFTVEVNPESITYEKLMLMKENKVNRISMGVESTINKNLNYLGRNHNFDLVKEKIDLIKEVGIKNINVDLIYALKNQDLQELEIDINNILSLDVPHISTYSLIIEKNTILSIKKEKNIDEEIDFSMYELIQEKLKENGYNHYEVSNFSKASYESRHNLVYWNNDHYYGFGLSSASYIDDTRMNNTLSLNKYLKGEYLDFKEELTKKDILSYALILGLRKIKGINKEEFYKKYNVDILNLYNIKELIEKGLLVDNGENIYVSYDKIYVENSILENFVGD